MKILVVSTGYVGLSNTGLMAQNNEVAAFDINTKTVDLINSGQWPIEDPEMEGFFPNKSLNLSATTPREIANKSAN